MAERPNTLRPGHWSAHRSEVGSPVAADPAVSGSFPDRGGLLNTEGYDSIMIGAVVTSALPGPSVTYEVLGYDPDLDRFYEVAQAGIGQLDGKTQVVATYGQRIFARITMLAGSPTAVQLRVIPGAGHYQGD